MGELGALFNPGMRHELEERRARAARREEEGNARDGDLRIDLDSGVAVINAPDDESADDATSKATSGDTTSAAASPERPGNGSAGPDGRPDESLADGVRVTDDAVSETAESAAESPARPAPVRPRGKRAMATRR